MIVVDDFCSGFVRDFAKKVRPDAFRRFDRAFYESPIAFLNSSFFELLCQPPSSTAIGAQHHRAGSRSIEPMRHAQIDVIRLLGPLPQVRFDADFKTIDARR